MDNKRNWKGYLYILPVLVIVGLFTVYPLVQVFAMSFFQKYDFSSGKFQSLGLANYRYLMQDPIFQKALSNTFIYVLVVTPITVGLSLLLAVALNSKIHFRGLFQTLYFLPYVSSTVAIGIVWSWIFHSRYGILNYILGRFGIAPVQWLNDPHTAMAALIIFSIWKGLSFDIVIFLAGLQNIDPQYYMAARVDAAPQHRVFFHITVPLVSPMIVYVFILEIINSFKVYTEIYSLFGGKAGPANSVMTVVFYIYDQFYGNFNFSVAAAAAVVLFFIILLVTLLQLRITRKKVFYY